MRRCVYLFAFLLAGPCTAAPAPASTSAWSSAEAQAEIEAFAKARAADVGNLVFGPRPPVLAPPDDKLSCAELYERRVVLMHAKSNYRPPFNDDPRTQVAVGFGMVSSISLAFLPFAAIQSYTDAIQKVDTEASLDTLRYASARQQCFVR